MVALVILLTVLLVALVLVIVFRRDWLMNLFGNSITTKVEKKKKLEGQVQVLKKEQKVKVEEATNINRVHKTETLDTITATINSYKAQIELLKKQKEDTEKIYAEELKVATDKVMNTYNRKIVSKENQIKKLGYYIDAEQKNIEDVISPDRPNAPTEPSQKKFLLEETKPVAKKPVKKSK